MVSARAYDRCWASSETPAPPSLSSYIPRPDSCGFLQSPTSPGSSTPTPLGVVVRQVGRPPTGTPVAPATRTPGTPASASFNSYIPSPAGRCLRQVPAPQLRPAGPPQVVTEVMQAVKKLAAQYRQKFQEAANLEDQVNQLESLHKLQAQQEPMSAVGFVVEARAYGSCWVNGLSKNLSAVWLMVSAKAYLAVGLMVTARAYVGCWFNGLSKSLCWLLGNGLSQSLCWLLC